MKQYCEVGKLNLFRIINLIIYLFFFNFFLDNLKIKYLLNIYSYVYFYLNKKYLIIIKINSSGSSLALLNYCSMTSIAMIYCRYFFQLYKLRIITCHYPSVVHWYRRVMRRTARQNVIINVRSILVIELDTSIASQSSLDA